MPFVLNLVRRYVLVAVALPLAAKALAAIGRKVEESRGPGLIPSVLQGGSRMIDRRQGKGQGKGKNKSKDDRG